MSPEPESCLSSAASELGDTELSYMEDQARVFSGASEPSTDGLSPPHIRDEPSLDFLDLSDKKDGVGSQEAWNYLATIADDVELDLSEEMGSSSSSTATPEPKAVTEVERKRKAGDMESTASTSPAAAGNDKDEEIKHELLAKDPATLSPEELKQLKKQRRLIKNRESAQLSRLRKKNHMETLEVQVQQLEKERAQLTAQMERLTEENKMLKKQLMATGRLPPTAVGPIPMKGAVRPHKGHTGMRGAMVFAMVFAVGMFFTNIDLQQEQMLPQLYRGSPQQLSAPAAQAHTGRGAGRVLLAATEEDYQPVNAVLNDPKQLLIVTLLDHVVGQLKSSPSLLSRLCYRLQELHVLDSCDFLEQMEQVRTRYMEDFKPFNDEFGVKIEDEVRMDAEFTFARSSETKALAKVIASSPPTVPTIPLKPRSPVVDAWGGIVEHGKLPDFKGLVKSDVNVLCPSAQLLIADKPANAEQDIGSKLQRLQNQKETEFVTNSTASNAHPKESFVPRENGRTSLSMLVPRNQLATEKLEEHLPKQHSHLVEVRCAAYDLHPFMPISSIDGSTPVSV